MTFQPGQSGNPLGRRAEDRQRDLKAQCRALTPKVMETLEKALDRPRDAVPAATLILAYGFGKPMNNLTVRKIQRITDLDDDELRAMLIDGEALPEQPQIEDGTADDGS